MTAEVFALAALSAAVSAGVSFGLVKAGLAHFGERLDRMDARLDKVHDATITHVTAIAVLQERHKQCESS